MKEFIKIISESHESLKLNKIDTDIAPILSKENVDIHYNILTKNYFKNQNKDDFQYAGAYLHNIWWENIQKEKSKPSGESAIWIEKHFDNFDRFKKLFVEEALSHNGSYWIGVDYKGTFIYIENHEAFDDLIILIDFWEHAYLIDYPGKKDEYANKILDHINWDVVSKRL